MSTRSRPAKTAPAAEDATDRRLRQIREAEERLEVLTRDANGVLSDLRREMKRAEKVTVDTITERLDEELRSVIEGLGNATSKALNEVTEIIFRRFDGMTNELLGEDGPRSTPLKDLLRSADARAAAKEAIERLGFEFAHATLNTGEAAVVLTKGGELV
jgi:hypothetical protein